MILVNKEEKQAISAALPHVHFHRTVKSKSKRHRYYMEEGNRAMVLLQKLRRGTGGCGESPRMTK